MRVMIVAGGTGGHVFPALAIALELIDCGMDVRWIGTKTGIESRVVPQHGLSIDALSVQSWRFQSPLHKIKSVFLCAWSVLQSLFFIHRYGPSVVLAMGGFVSGPLGLAAKISRVPLILHEQNACMGLANRWLSPFASKILMGFPAYKELDSCFSRTHSLKHVFVGNPVRAEIAALPPPAIRFQGREVLRPRILVLGGSRGASSLNKLLPPMLAEGWNGVELKTLDPRLRGVDKTLANDNEPGDPRTGFDLWHQTGEKDVASVKAAYQSFSLPARVDAFIEDMAIAYAWADIVICRSGASTIAELMAVGLPSILIPYPFHADDHQYSNAMALVEPGAAYCIRQSDLTPEKLQTTLLPLVSDRARRIAMAEKARALCPGNALERVIQEIISE